MQSTGVYSSSFDLATTVSLFDACSVVRLFLLYSAMVWQHHSQTVEARPSLRSLATSSSSSSSSATELPRRHNHHNSHRSRRDRKTMEERRRQRDAAAATDVNLWLKLMAEGRSLAESNAASTSGAAESSSIQMRSADNSNNNSKDKRKPRNISPSIHGRILRRRQLYCRTGYHLQILPDGTVNGTHEDHSRFGILEFMPIMNGLQIYGPQRIAIRGVASRRYLCMNKRGQLYGSKVKTDECEFMQNMEKNYYETWWSSKYPLHKKSRKNANGKKKAAKRWYIALDREGHRRSGRKSRRVQKFTHFLTRPVDWRKVPHLFDSRYIALNVEDLGTLGGGKSSSTETPTLLPSNFENRISLDESDDGSSSSSSSSSSLSSTNSEGVMIVIGDSSSSSSFPASSSSSSTLSDNRVEKEAGSRRGSSRGKTRSHRKGRNGGRKMRRKFARRRQLIQKQFEKQLLQQERQEVSKQVSQVFMVQNP